MIKTEDIVSFEKALEMVSDSIELFKRFAGALDAFLLKHELGRAELLIEEKSEVTHRGYEFARFYLRYPDGTDLLYADLYTNGTATGESFSKTVWGRREGGINDSWDDLIKEVLKEVGITMSKSSYVPREKIEKIIEMLG